MVKLSIKTWTVVSREGIGCINRVPVRQISGNEILKYEIFEIFDGFTFSLFCQGKLFLFQFFILPFGFGNLKITSVEMNALERHHTVCFRGQDGFCPPSIDFKRFKPSSISVLGQSSKSHDPLVRTVVLPLYPKSSFSTRNEGSFCFLRQPREFFRSGLLGELLLSSVGVFRLILSFLLVLSMHLRNVFWLAYLPAPVSRMTLESVYRTVLISDVTYGPFSSPLCGSWIPYPGCPNLEYILINDYYKSIRETILIAF